MKKKICIFSIILISITTVYIVGVWEPTEDSSAVNGKNITTSKEENKEEKDKKEFRVNKEELLNKLNKSEKEELSNILKNISVVDMGKIEEYITNESGDKDFKDALELLKKRLSKAEYNKALEVLSPYIDLEILN